MKTTGRGDDLIEAKPSKIAMADCVCEDAECEMHTCMLACVKQYQKCNSIWAAPRRNEKYHRDMLVKDDRKSHCEINSKPKHTKKKTRADIS